jgi:hypothetical protein
VIVAVKITGAPYREGLGVVERNTLFCAWSRCGSAAARSQKSRGKRCLREAIGVVSAICRKTSMRGPIDVQHIAEQRGVKFTIWWNGLKITLIALDVPLQDGGVSGNGIGFVWYIAGAARRRDA